MELRHGAGRRVLRHRGSRWPPSRHRGAHKTQKAHFRRAQVPRENFSVRARAREAGQEGAELSAGQAARRAFHRASAL